MDWWLSPTESTRLHLLDSDCYGRSYVNKGWYHEKWEKIGCKNCNWTVLSASFLSIVITDWEGKSLSILLRIPLCTAWTQTCVWVSPKYTRFSSDPNAPKLNVCVLQLNCNTLSDLQGAAKSVDNPLKKIKTRTYKACVALCNMATSRERRAALMINADVQRRSRIRQDITLH